MATRKKDSDPRGGTSGGSQRQLRVGELVRHAVAGGAERAFTALQPVLPGCDVRPVNGSELELPTAGKHRYLIPLERDGEP